MILRNREAGEGLGDFFEFELAALGDVVGAVERVLDFAEQRHHLFARLDVEGFLFEAHAVQIRHRLAGLNAQQDFVGAGVGLAQVVGIVGGDQRDAGVGRQAMHQRHDFGVGLQAVILQFEEEILGAEQVCVFVGDAARVFVAVLQESFVDVAAQACRERDQALGVAREQVLIDARLVVEAVEVAGGNQLDEVAVAFLVFAQQHQVVVAVGFAAHADALLGDVDFAADHGVDAVFLGLVIELDGAEEVAVIGHGDGGHFLLGHHLHKLRDLAGSVEQRVVGVAVKMNERVRHAI